MKKNNYIGRFIGYTMLIVRFRFSFLPKGLLLTFIIGLLSEGEVKGQLIFKNENEDPLFSYDEVPVLVTIEGYGNFYIDAIYTNNNLLYINIENLFTTLQIPCIASENGDKLDGFIGSDGHPYSFDYTKRYLIVGDKKVNLKDGLLKEMGSIYMESYLFADLFGIALNFNFRSLTIQLKSDFELPFVKQQRIEKLRGNMAKVKGEVIADTVVQRNYHLFQFGTLDWSVASFQATKGPGENRFGLGIGTEFLYGEANVAINYSDRYKFDNRQLYYLWRWIDNDKSLIKQAQIGKVSNQTISFIDAPVVGAVVRNSPTTVRKAKGYYIINELTEPNWTVELYINDVMVDYTTADASGLYLFKVPIVYGYTTLNLKFYGPLGEERMEERTMNVPYTVMPTGEFEYGLSAGMVQDSSRSRFGRAEFNYGVNRFLTVGGGIEYLSSIPNGAYIPYARATFQPFGKLTINAEYDHGVKVRGLLDYYFGKSTLLEIEYSKYKEGQLATRFNSLEERKVKLSVPFRYKKIIGFSKFDYAQFVYKPFNYNQANTTFSAYYKQFSANSSTQLNWIDQKSAYITSNLALSYRLKQGYIIRPSAQYNVSESKFITYKIAIEKSIPKGYLTATYERSVLSDDNLLSINFKYDLNFARTNVNATHRNGNIILSESAQGSLAFGSGNNYIHGSNNSSVGKGGISIYPFLDLNYNGIFDANEHLVKLTSVRIMGSRAIFSEKDSIVRIPDLNAFINYRIELDDNDLENISWRFENKIYSVLIDPNQFKRVDIPVIPVGEVSGMAYINNDNSLKGIGRISVKIYKKDGLKVVAETLSESDGYIYYLGLRPGEYVAMVDPEQLSNLDLTASPSQIDFTIKTSEQGDMIGGIDFILRSEQKNIPPPDNSENMQPIPMPQIAEQVSVVKDSIVYIPGETLYNLQLLSLSSPVKIEDYFEQLLSDIPGLTIVETQAEDGFFHYSTGVFRNILDVRELLARFSISGWKDCSIVVYTGEEHAATMFYLKHMTQ